MRGYFGTAWPITAAYAILSHTHRPAPTHSIFGLGPLRSEFRSTHMLFCDCKPARWCDCESTFNRAYIKIYLAYCSQVEIRKSATVQCSRLRIKNGVVITETTWFYQDNLCIRYYSCYRLRTIRICRLLNKHDRLVRNEKLPRNITSDYKSVSKILYFRIHPWQNQDKPKLTDIYTCSSLQ